MWEQLTTEDLLSQDDIFCLEPEVTLTLYVQLTFYDKGSPFASHNMNVLENYN